MALLWLFFHPPQGKRLYHVALLFYHIRMKHAQNESHHLLAKLLLMAAPVLVHQENFLLAGYWHQQQQNCQHNTLLESADRQFQGIK